MKRSPTQKPVLTQVDIDWLLDSMEKRFVTQEKFDKKIDKLFTTLDGVVGTIKKLDEEHTVHQASHDRVDRRLNRLEKHTKLAPLID